MGHDSRVTVTIPADLYWEMKREYDRREKNYRSPREEAPYEWYNRQLRPAKGDSDFDH